MDSDETNSIPEEEDSILEEELYRPGTSMLMTRDQGALFGPDQNRQEKKQSGAMKLVTRGAAKSIDYYLLFGIIAQRRLEGASSVMFDLVENVPRPPMRQRFVSQFSGQLLRMMAAHVMAEMEALSADLGGRGTKR